MSQETSTNPTPKPIVRQKVRNTIATRRGLGHINRFLNDNGLLVGPYRDEALPNAKARRDFDQARRWIEENARYA